MATYKELSNGSSGSDVKKMQQALLDAGYDLGSYGADGVYGNATAAAVKQYQKDNGLTVDGIAGDQTLGSLYATKAPTVPATTTAPAATLPLDMSQFTYDPSTNDAYQQALEALQQAQGQLPSYKGTYDQQIKDIYDQISNREKFSYDLNADALYQQYKDQYTQGGKMAMMDTMGQAAALTGGYGSSYGQSVGQQAYQGYLKELNNVVPELYNLALNQYNQEGDRMLQQYSMLGDMADTEYGRYQDDLNQYWQNVSFLKQQADDAYSKGFDSWYTAYNNAYQANRDQIADQQWQAQFDEAKRQYDQEYAFAQQQYNDAKSSSYSGGSGNNTYYTGDNGNVISAAAGVPDSIRTKAASFNSNNDLANYLDSLSANGTITIDQADALYAEYMAPDRVALSQRNWTVNNDGGINIFGIDRNAEVKDQYGNVYRLDKLVGALETEGMTKAEAKEYVKNLQKNLGI